jgi:hypothetical protein
MVDPRQPARVAMVLAEPGNASELASSRKYRIFGRHTLAHVSFREQANMLIDFVAQFSIRGASDKKTAQSGGDHP